MSGEKKRLLSELELQNIAANLSDISDVDELFDDSDVDPCYAESSNYFSEDSDQRRKKLKTQDQPQQVCYFVLLYYHYLYRTAAQRREGNVFHLGPSIYVEMFLS